MSGGPTYENATRISVVLFKLAHKYLRLFSIGKNDYLILMRILFYIEAQAQFSVINNY